MISKPQRMGPAGCVMMLGDAGMDLAGAFPKHPVIARFVGCDQPVHAGFHHRAQRVAGQRPQRHPLADEPGKFQAAALQGLGKFQNIGFAACEQIVEEVDFLDPLRQRVLDFPHRVFDRLAAVFLARSAQMGDTAIRTSQDTASRQHDIAVFGTARGVANLANLQRLFILRDMGSVQQVIGGPWQQPGIDLWIAIGAIQAAIAGLKSNAGHRARIALFGQDRQQRPQGEIDLAANRIAANPLRHRQAGIVGCRVAGQNGHHIGVLCFGEVEYLPAVPVLRRCKRENRLDHDHRIGRELRHMAAQFLVPVFDMHAQIEQRDRKSARQ